MSDVGEGCQCVRCITEWILHGKKHKSDCAVHNDCWYRDDIPFVRCTCIPE